MTKTAVERACKRLGHRWTPWEPTAGSTPHVLVIGAAIGEWRRCERCGDEESRIYPAKALT